MKLKLSSIADTGNSEKERVVIAVTRDADVGRFAIFRAKLDDEGNPTTEVSDVFWFPDKEVKSGDLVVLYSKAGTMSERPRTRGQTAGTANVHFFYWGKSRALWTSENRFIPLLVSTATWEWLKG